MLLVQKIIKINNLLARLKTFSVKGSTSKRSWSVYNSFLTAIYDIIKCEDDMSFSYQSAYASQSKAVPFPPAGGGPLCFKL